MDIERQITRLQESMASLIDEQEQHKRISEQTLEQAKATNGRITALEDTVYGAKDDRRRISHPGIEKRVSDMEKGFNDARAVTKAAWALVGLVGVSGIAGLIAFLAQLP